MRFPRLFLVLTMLVFTQTAHSALISNQNFYGNILLSDKPAAPVKLAMAPVQRTIDAINQERNLSRKIAMMDTAAFSITRSYLEALRSSWKMLSPEALTDAMNNPLKGNNFERLVTHTRHSTLALQLLDQHYNPQHAQLAAASKAPVMVIRPKASTKIMSPYANQALSSYSQFTGGLMNPLISGTFSSPFGMRWGKMHTGTDISAPIGTPFYAAGDGIVVGAGPDSGYGLLITIQHSGQLKTRYAHCSSFAVFPGQSVKRGQYIGNVGMTGHVTGAHLHFEMQLRFQQTLNACYF